MPVLKKDRELQEVALKTVEGGIVKIIKSVLGEDIEKIVAAKVDGASPLTPLTVIIREWNLTDEAGAALAVTVENLRLLKLVDVSAIMAAVEGLDDFLGKGQSAAG